MTQINLSLHSKLPPGSYIDEKNGPDGLIYEDINNLLWKMLKKSHNSSVGLDFDGKPDDSLTENDI